MHRRRFNVLLALAAALRCTPSRAQAAASRPHDPFGPVRPPLALPPVRVRTHRGADVALDDLLRGRVTALQFMYTGCSATCPIQGAIFAEAQRRIGVAPPGLQWLSLSIDTLADDPPALSRWLLALQAGPAWSAATPPAGDLDRLLEALRAGSGGPDRHAGAVFVMDRQARLVYRTVDLPSPVSLAALMREAAGA